MKFSFKIQDYQTDAVEAVGHVSFAAENERANIRQRQAEGIAAAKARGGRFGRPPKPLPENFQQVYRQWKIGTMTGVAAAEPCGMLSSGTSDYFNFDRHAKCSVRHSMSRYPFLVLHFCFFG